MTLTEYVYARLYRMTWPQPLVFMNVSWRLITLLNRLCFIFLAAYNMRLFNAANVSNNANKKTAFVGARIPLDLNAAIDALAPYYKGGKSELLRRSIAEGLQIVHNSHIVNLPMRRYGTAN